LFAVDWPYADNTKGVVWLKNCSLEDNTKADIFARNAETFLKL
jgi:predicted TIM-barrel fold metal-dependent hydrolase